MPRFLARYPDITLELITGVNTASVVRNDADIALRLIRPEQNTLKKVGVTSRCRRIAAIAPPSSALSKQPTFCVK
ncbi:hypothetical protein [Serratia sp. JUb9]|uniref:hypothetical protein n=1 Tax=Serratia sp. JUb9 TaxID=2724469 RepID=UPI001C9A2F2E|nr:hypothetical protein [Serratia sp. JUb9]